MVSHDPITHSIIPVAEFVTTAHDQNNISKYLFSIRDKILENSAPLAKTIITDHSWALINAVLLTFNGCNIANYLNWCFLMLTKIPNEALSNTMKVRLYLCSFHFLKSAKAKLRSFPNSTTFLKTTFLFMFTLVQNSQTLQQINKYLVNIYNVFNSKHLDYTVLYSLKFLMHEIRNRELGCIDINCSNTDRNERDKFFNQFLKYSQIFISSDFKYNLVKDSPFTGYFNEVIEKSKSDKSEKLKLDKTNIENLALNELYNPEIFKILLNEMYLVPLWTFVMIDPTTFNYKVKTRLANNVAEKKKKKKPSRN